MAKAVTEIHLEMANAMNKKDLACENVQQMVEMEQPLLLSQPTDLSSDDWEQQHMAEVMHTEIHLEMPNGTNQKELACESAQQMVELRRPLLLSRPTDLSFDDLQRQHVEDEVKCIKEMIQDCGHGFELRDCIRVPIRIRNLKEEAYTPKVVSIGPFHCRSERLQDMENQKQILFKDFIQRTLSSLEDLIRFVKDLEPKVRDSYSENIDLTEQELVKLTLVDAGFIIELFIRSHEMRKECDKLSQPLLVNSILEDLILLENQLPFFVIEEIYNRAFPDHMPNNRAFNGDSSGLPSFLDLTYKYFWYYNKQALRPDPDVRIKHFTDLLRLFHLRKTKMPEQIPSPEAGRHILLYNANALQEKGIKLKASKSECLLDLKFSGHVLEIPQILVDDTTESLFRNMIALEQCHYLGDTYITDYALILDCLIDTYEDVDLLVYKRIVRNYFGDTNKVVLLFNGLGGNFTRWNFNPEYLDICKRLNGYCQHPWHKMWPTLKRDYCNTPWHTVASTAGILLIILTIVQTIFSVLQVVLK